MRRAGKPLTAFVLLSCLLLCSCGIGSRLENTGEQGPSGTQSEAQGGVTQVSNTQPSTESNIISLRLSSKEAPWYNSYSFHIRENDGAVLFDGTCALDDGYTSREVTVEGAEVAREDMDALRALCGEYGINAQRSRKRSETNAVIEIEWENGVRLVTGEAYDVERGVRVFLTELTARVKNAEPPKPSVNGRIVAIEMSWWDGRMPPYSYSLREEGGRFLFNAKTGHREEFKLENAVAARADMEALQALCDDYGYMPGKYAPHRPKGMFIHDEAFPTLNITWASGARLEAKVSFQGDNALRAVFDDLSRRLSTPPAQGKVTSLELSSNDGGMYHLREQDGEVLFDMAIASWNSPTFKEINLIRVEASRADMNAVNSICAEYGLIDIQHSYRPPMPYYVQNIAGNRHGVFFTVKWENGGWFHADSAYGSEEALTAYLWELALRLDAEK